MGGERLTEVLVGSSKSNHLASSLLEALPEQTVDLRE